MAADTWNLAAATARDTCYDRIIAGVSESERHMINLTAIAGPLGLAACALLLVFWLLISRKFLGFVYVAIGWALIVSLIHSDGKTSTMLGILLIGGFVGALFIATYALVRSRQMTAKSRGPRYIPANKK